MLTSMAGLELSAGLIFLTSILHFSQNKQGSTFLKPILIACSLLFGAALMSHFANSQWEFMPKTAAWFSRWILFLASCSYLFKNFPSAKTPWVAGMYTGFALAFTTSLYQYFTNYDFIRGQNINFYANLSKETTRVIGFFSMPTTYGYILAMFSLVPLFLLTQSNTSKRWLHGVVFLMTSVNLFMTYTRGAWIAMVFGLFLFLYLNKRTWLIPTVVSLVILVSAGLGLNQGFRERISSLGSSQYYSNLQRLELWHAHWKIFTDNPLFGVGFNQNDWVVESYHESMGHTEKHRSHAHNSYLQYLAGTGSFGFIALIFLFATLLKQGLSVTHQEGKVPPQRLALVCIAGIFLTSILFDCNFGDSEVRFSFLTYMSLMLAKS